MNNPLEECTAAFNALSDFMTSSASYLVGEGLPPTPLDLVDFMDYTQSLEELIRRVPEAAAFQNGAMQEVVYTVAASLREIDMASRSKSTLLAAAASELQAEADYYKNTGQFLFGIMKGAPTNGSQC